MNLTKPDCARRLNDDAPTDSIWNRWSLSIIATSVAQAVAIVLFAELCWLLLDYLVEHSSFYLAPLYMLVLYHLPIGVAALRKHNAVLDIILANYWLGWTIIGWFAVLIWACNWNVEPTAPMERTRPSTDAASL